MTLATQNNEMSHQILEVENTRKMAESLFKTPHYAKMGPDGIFAIISKARSLGMDLIEALNGGLYYLQGKVGMPAESMASLIRQKGHSITKDPKSNNEICILHGRRGDNGDTWTTSFSMDDARRAGLAKNMYEKYPSTMLYNRAMSFLARQLFPDVIRGAGYCYEELKEIITHTAPTATITASADTIDEMKIETISEEQASDLKEIFEQCDPSYPLQVLMHAKVEKVEQIPTVLYPRIKRAAEKKKEEYFQSQMMEGESVSA